MLSNPTSAIETRRRSHRRQNSTPNIEVGQLRRPPVSASINTGIQRANSQRVAGHRRGLSLDQHHPRLITSTKLTPTLGPISQDDISVSIGSTNNHNTGPAQYRNNVVAQASLAQPGQVSDQQFHHQVYSSPLAIQTQDFSFPSQNSPFPSQNSPFAGMSPHASMESPNPFTPGAMPHAPLTAAPQFQQLHPTLQQIEDLNKHIKSVYGMMGEVHINILPTPVATPQKRPMTMDKLDVTGMPLKFDNADLTLDPSLMGQDFKLNLQSPSSEREYASSFYSSPPHSVSCSPQQGSIKTFVATTEPGLMFSSQTSLVDVEPMMIPTDGTNSPSRSPRPVSIADLSIDGTIEDTGISEAEIQQYISAQDQSSHRWTCLYPGCDAKTFGRRENIRSHVQTHLGDRQYRCNHCSKCFVRQHDLKRHSKIHSGNKPYKCPCGGGFARQDALTRHRQRGMCIGGFPNAVRKQARRGRPKKLRPDQEDRLEKAAFLASRDRANSAASSVSDGSEGSRSPSPLLGSMHSMPYHGGDFRHSETVRLMDLPEDDDDEIDTFGLAPSPPPSGIDTILKNNNSLDQFSTPEHPSTTSYHNLINPANLAYTPPASSPAEMDMSSHSMHHHLTSSPTLHRRANSNSPIRPRTPSLEPSNNRDRSSLIASDPNLALHATPPTSPLLCASSTTTTSSSSIISTAAPGRADDLLSSFDALGEEGSILIHGGDTSGMDMDAMGISFSGGSVCGAPSDCVDPVLADPFSGSLGGLEFLKGEVGGESSFGMWDL